MSTLSRDLSSISEQLETRLRDAKSSAGTSESALLDSCQRCIDVSAELQSAIDELQVRGTTRIEIAAKSFVSALKSIWNESQIEKLRSRLIEIRSQMMIATVVSIWSEP